MKKLLTKLMMAAILATQSAEAKPHYLAKKVGFYVCKAVYLPVCVVAGAAIGGATGLVAGAGIAIIHWSLLEPPKPPKKAEKDEK